MKKFTMFALTVAAILVSCNKSDDPKPEEKTTTIDGELFEPTGSSVQQYNNKLVLSFTQGTKTVEITTNDTIAGTYTITALKESVSLRATLVLNDGQKTYAATSGKVTITKSTGKISGTYEAELASENNSTISIKGGEFSEIAPEIVSPYIKTLAVLSDSLTSAYNSFHNLVEFNNLFDAVFVKNIQAPNASWNNIYNHSVIPTDSKALLLWNKSYSLILQCNLIIESGKKLTTDANAIAQVTAQARTIRAFAYYYLSSWFGDVPLETGITAELASRKTVSEVNTLMLADLDEALTVLPAAWTGEDKFRTNKYVALGLKARIKLSSNDFANAKASAEEIIHSAQYALGYDTIKLKATSTEIIMGFAKSSNTELAGLSRIDTYVSVMRLTEVYLIAARAAYNMGMTMDALQYLNILLQRSNQQVLSQITDADISGRWIRELAQEGGSLRVLKLFGLALNTLQVQEYKLLLPIPQLILDQNPGITQNPGY
ncbi:MAG TPA: RagB/SusD family nutrient uptake outer membrane protein [Bacteroidales bacterium]|nr:RagB/SusD family nutrient uptake outer membrane protein [Bacteroidales bacterium]